MSTIGIDLKSLGSRTVSSAFSSLDKLAVEFEDGNAILIDIPKETPFAHLDMHIVKATDLAREEEAVCKVDWSWIFGSKLVDVQASGHTITLQLDPAGPVSASLQYWQGKPFLAFQPFRAPK